MGNFFLIKGKNSWGNRVTRNLNEKLVKKYVFINLHKNVIKISFDSFKKIDKIAIFWFATLGAGVCLSNATMHKIRNYSRFDFMLYILL